MAKLTLTNITTGHLGTSTFNTNNDLIEAALENTLSRDGTSPNTMSVDIDMNSNRITNLTDGVNNQDGVTVAQLNGATLTGSGVINASTFDAQSSTDGQVLTSDGAGNAAWEAIPAQEGTTILSTGATDGYVLTADGAGGVAWEEGGAALTPWTENIDAAAYQLQNPEIKDYSVTSSSPSSSSGAITFDIENGNAFEVTLTENITSITLSNPSATGKYCEIIIKFKQDVTGSRTLAGWAAGVKWPGSTAPVLSTTGSSVDIITLKTWDAGTLWYGDYSKDYA